MEIAFEPTVGVEEHDSRSTARRSFIWLHSNRRNDRLASGSLAGKEAEDEVLSHMGVRTELLYNLNEQQRCAVQTTEGPLLVLAGAGTGKTTVLTSRIAYLVLGGVPPQKILAVTFTRKAAQEMKERVEGLLGGSAHGLTVSTFHSFGFRTLRELSRGNFHVLDESERHRLITELLIQLDVYMDPEQALAQISRAKNSGISPGEVCRRAKTVDEESFADCYAAYCEELRRRKAIDFDDMISLPLEILSSSSRARATFQSRFRYVLVDEYQDTNPVQYDLMRALLGDNPNICVVGDDDQAIYGFRGATVERILHFREDFRDAATVTLEINYRSHSEIMSLANAIMSRAQNRHPKRLVSHRGPGAEISWQRCATEHSEAAYVVAQVQSLAATGQFSFRDIGVITRVTQDAEGIRTAFKTSGVPYVAGKTASENAVSVMTLHQAKGLEFPVVFVPALEQDSLPHYFALKEGVKAIEEERRLLYVAVTRAMKTLFLTTSSTRNGRDRSVSSFLRQLPRSNALRWTIDLSWFKPRFR